MIKKETWRHFDFLLFGAVIILCAFGVAMIRSAVAGSPGLEGYDRRQIYFILAGLAVIIFIAAIDYHLWSSLSRVMYIFTFLALVVIFIVGAVSFGSARWIKTGLVDIQPSELAKIVIVLALAEYFSKTRHEEKNLKWVAMSGLMAVGFVVWIMLQPNLSTSIVIMVLWFSMLWISGLPTKYIFLFALLAVIMGAALFPFLEEYQQQRVANFFFPDPNARHGDNYNVDQALISIGSGGMFGQGYGHGTQVQLRFLKVRHTDFIFAVMAEEFGFIGTSVVIALIVFVIYRCFRAARMAGDMYGALIAYGFAVLMFFQMSVNIGVNLKVIPVTGLTLPFISYGGSSLLSLCLGIGLVESVIMRHKSLDF